MNTTSNMASVYDLYNEAMYKHAMEPPIYKAAPNTQMESDTTRDRKGLLSHPIPSNKATPHKLEGSEIGTIDESLLKLYNKINGNIAKSSPDVEENEDTVEISKEGFNEKIHHLGNHHLPHPSFGGGHIVGLTKPTNSGYYIAPLHSSPDCGCSTKKGDEIMFKIYMGSMTVVGLLILYRILQK